MGTKRRTRTRTRTASPAPPATSPPAPSQGAEEEEEKEEENKEEEDEEKDQEEDERETGTQGAQALLVSTAPARASLLATALTYPVAVAPRGVREAQWSEKRRRTRRGVVHKISLTYQKRDDGTEK